MKVFDNIHSKDIDGLVDWLDKNGAYDHTPWERWYNKNYCRKCGAVTTSSTEDCYGNYWESSHEFLWCELYGNCRYFQDMKKVPNRKQTIKLWLESEAE